MFSNDPPLVYFTVWALGLDSIRTLNTTIDFRPPTLDPEPHTPYLHPVELADQPRRWVVAMPNLLSGLRLVLVGLFPFALQAWAVGLILVAGLSDYLDGVIARRFKACHWTGGLLDAVADKLFMLMVLSTYVVRDHLLWWQALVLISRDVVVVAIAAYAVWQRRWFAFRRMGSRYLGKLTTVALFVLYLIIALQAEAGAFSLSVFAVTATLSILAAVDYFILFHKHRHETS